MPWLTARTDREIEVPLGDIEQRPVIQRDQAPWHRASIERAPL